MLSSLFNSGTDGGDLFSKKEALPAPVTNNYNASSKREAKKGSVTVDEATGHRIVKGGKKRMKQVEKAAQKPQEKDDMARGC